ncbi:amino acid ABC transporter substrate-binding protein (PAAT family) [Desulfobotulus alkaliphilus]|uniref:Amino acid ABC transporter substrate-binding protein (PAAT family) n=1 Tax=Desulfobotulus alkaliphilus TaxID=622671 RepID=A0A562RN59_9BACT|nr:ABC transporter substrate-binding protein [Desulfobotulus alkaliphilus]TWI70323.1 amino acid ABC transporter substrate-binding protein (PAAT family) [Desulfobotulus alkaliphilus]
MKFPGRILLILLMALTLTAQAEPERKLTGISLDWEPYIGAHMPQQGYVAQIVREAFKAGGGYTMDVEFMAWTWVVALADSGRYDFYFPEYYDAKLEEKYYISDPIPGGPLVFFKRKDTNIQYNHLQDLRPHKIGTVRGYVNTPEFDNADYLTKVEAMTDMENIQNLLNGKIQVMVMDKYVGLHLLRTKSSDRAMEVEVMTPPLGVNDLHVCFPKKTGNAREHLEALNQGLKILKETGRVKEIMQSHGF